MGHLRIAVAAVVMAIWAAVYGSWILEGMPQPSPPAEVSGLMLAVVTGLFGGELRDVVKKRKNGGGGG